MAIIEFQPLNDTSGTTPDQSPEQALALFRHREVLTALSNVCCTQGEDVAVTAYSARHPQLVIPSSNDGSERERQIGMVVDPVVLGFSTELQRPYYRSEELLINYERRCGLPDFVIAAISENAGNPNHHQAEHQYPDLFLS
jgi:hypothetical protein